jgi:L-alanine-DL-glutamate epimerase-like enolase superfamily enzyme
MPQSRVAKVLHLRQFLNVMKTTDIQIVSSELYLLPTRARCPLKFGHQVVTQVTCARVKLTVRNRAGQEAVGWGETPLNVEWAWPSHLTYEFRYQSMESFCLKLASAWSEFNQFGHPLELGNDFMEFVLPGLVAAHQSNLLAEQAISRLATLICTSAFDLALHDAYGELLKRPTYSTYGKEFLNRDLSSFLASNNDEGSRFAGIYPEAFLIAKRPERLPAWHLVGGLDPIEASDVNDLRPDDGYPVTLVDWIERDGLTCLKIKLRGNDASWDYARLVRVGLTGYSRGVEWLTADFNCTVESPEYVNDILDRLLCEHPKLYQQLLYVEQPFPYDLEAYPIDVRSVGARKPIFMDESAHDWKLVALGRSLGWSGVALKTCKTQTGALLSLCWAKSHGMPLMVQDLSNPMMAQISHVLLAAHAGTIMGVETNGSQFFPAASTIEARVHPGLYQRRHGTVDLSTVGQTGLGYRVSEISRTLPPPAIRCEC